MRKEVNIINFIILRKVSFCGLIRVKGDGKGIGSKEVNVFEKLFYFLFCVVFLVR